MCASVLAIWVRVFKVKPCLLSSCYDLKNHDRCRGVGADQAMSSYLKSVGG